MGTRQVETPDATQKIDNVYQYIKNQEAHHQKLTFRQEYISLLEEFSIPYNQQYNFKEPE